MLGTLNGALEVRGVTLPADAIEADVRGVNEIRDRIPVLTRIEVHYRLTIPQDAREKLDRALATHQEKCPTANSLSGAVEISWTADIEQT
jgi:organic hydroperoxide reductase OsmC/OhrA